MTELEKTKSELNFSINLLSSFFELVEEDLGREKVLYFIFMATAKAIEQEMDSKNNELHEDEIS